MYADLWEVLEEEASGHGEVRRRIHPESVADLWLVVYSPGLVRALRVAVDPETADLGDLPSGSGIDVRYNMVVGTGDVLEIQFGMLTRKLDVSIFHRLHALPVGLRDF